MSDKQPLPEDAAIEAAHPLRTGDHATYAEAMRLVGARSAKHGRRNSTPRHDTQIPPSAR